MPAYQRLIVAEGIDERRNSQWIVTVAKGYAYIAQQSASFRASNRTRAESFTELLFCQREQRDQFRVAAYAGSRTEFLSPLHTDWLSLRPGLLSCRQALRGLARLFPETQAFFRHLIDRTYFLADVAAKDEVAHQWT